MGLTQETLNMACPALDRPAFGDRYVEIRTLINQLKTLANELRTINLDQILTDPGLAKATTTTKVKTTASAVYLINGKLYTKAAADNLFDLTGEDSVAAEKYRCTKLILDSSGTATVVSGEDADSAAAALAAAGATTADKCCVGYHIVGDGTNAHDFSSDAVDAHGGAMVVGVPDFSATQATASDVTALSTYD